MKVLRLLSLATLIIALGAGAASCNKPNDAEIQKAAQQLVGLNPDLIGITVTVKDQVANLAGTVSDESVKSLAESTVAGVKNVKSVINLLEVVPPAPDYTTLDATINTALPDALKDHKTVTATVKEGIITLSGEIKEKDLPTLMQKLNALSPVKIENNLTVK